MAEYIVEYPDYAVSASRIEECINVHEKIVRCKDCKYYDHEELFDDDMWWCMRGTSDESVFEVEPYGFCKWGERR